MSIRLMGIRIVIALFGLTAMAQAHAWGDDGHRVVGEIAWHYLEPEVAAEVALLLETAGEPHLAESATWADRIRSDESYNWAAPLHYINLPRDWSTYIEVRDCPPAGCILKAIKSYEAILADRERNKIARAEALMFIAHFVGDLHQPLHTGLFSDRGGNDVQVQLHGTDTNLHALWDIHLVSRLVSDWADYAVEQTEKISTAERQRWQSTSVSVWAEESHKLAHNLAYTTESQLGEKYFLRCRESVEMRLQQGGVRLASVLNRALSNPVMDVAND
ncbi:S1/P1 nuclease [Microbulbifer sp. OS29]|uniref:S1/P1 nuclease n=1 Tax=Microbulbifer okhotskensis TaxID=2926617 RepID=A0A9X2EMS5_9GAMM|nr:S1/P1 nuclease [Microbulbifer okhotskensis]MCO1335134.1 S1/P1 nuclease [Microbulbifer okhotskensis]